MPTSTETSTYGAPCAKYSMAIHHPRSHAAALASVSTDSASSSQMPSRNDSALDLQAAAAETGGGERGDANTPPPAVNTAFTPPSRKKASKEEIKAATERMAAAGLALKEAMAAGAGVKEAQAALAAAKEAKVALMGGKSK